MVPGDLKRVFAGVVAARKEGEAGLERVRGETAALRNLANAGRMVEDNPGLLQLRMLQQLGGSSGNTVMLTMPDGQGSTGSTPAPAARAVRPRVSGTGPRSNRRPTPEGRRRRGSRLPLRTLGGRGFSPAADVRIRTDVPCHFGMIPP